MISVRCGLTCEADLGDARLEAKALPISPPAGHV